MSTAALLHHSYIVLYGNTLLELQGYNCVVVMSRRGRYPCTKRDMMESVSCGGWIFNFTLNFTQKTGASFLQHNNILALQATMCTITVEVGVTRVKLSSTPRRVTEVTTNENEEQC